MPKKNFLVITLFLFFGRADAQTLSPDSALYFLLKTDRLLPVLMDSALQHSAMLQKSENNISMYQSNLEVDKKAFLNSIVLSSAYGYGNIGSLTVGKDIGSGNPLTDYNTTQSSRYNLGVTLQLPLTAILSRKYQMRSTEMQIRMAENDRTSTELFVKQETIKMYQAFKLAHSMMLTAAKIKQSAFLGSSMGQKDFVAGQLTVGQYSEAQNVYNKAAMDYDIQVNSFQTAYLLLETYAGVNLAKLIKKYQQ